MIDTTEMNFDTALALLESNDAFPVDFDVAWQSVGYSSKHKAKNKLTKHFEIGIDYTLNHLVERVEGNNGGGSVRSESIKLTLDCFKAFCMMAGTEKGKEVRRYFLQCERQLKQLLSESGSNSFLAQLIEHRVNARLAPRFEGIENRLERVEAEAYALLARKKVKLLPTKITTQSQLVLDYLSQHQGEKFPAETLAALVNISYDSLRRLLPILHRRGLIERCSNPAFTGNRAGKGIPKYLYSDAAPKGGRSLSQSILSN